MIINIASAVGLSVRGCERVSGNNIRRQPSHPSLVRRFGCVRRTRVISSLGDAPEPTSGAALSRRDAVVGSGLAVLLALCAEQPAGAASKQLNIIITGANSGIGFDAAGKLAAKGHRVTLACRTLAKAEAAAAAIAASSPSSAPLLVPAECDLASWASIRAFAAAAGTSPIDVMVLNAGLQFTGAEKPRFTADGLEETVGVNHFGHFLLANLLLPAVERSGAGARIVVTASEARERTATLSRPPTLPLPVHDPESPGGAVGPAGTLGDLSGLLSGKPGFLMVDGGAFDAEKAYKDSKLCNVLFTRELARRLAASGSSVTVNAFGPGLITRTGFFRNQNPLFVSVFDFAANDLLRFAETVGGGGDCLAFMALDPSLDGKSGLFYNNNLAGFGGHSFALTEPSKEARDDAEAAKLWDASARLVGLQA